ncbi:hypothetical protein JOL79_11235 [Microbispora sp. RL4-1S]|uniref:Uncharacterized protein n=1 Tax=Microbispora oryzae TaxID=2806554 RepID=A0A940WF83_9ACTN|nr:hypothetical protein [Microbispora oryzae]MBP2704386.1 hypothetical protein [Microbispora oryzae]
MSNRRTPAEMAAIEAAAEESARRAEADARQAARDCARGSALAKRIRELNAANHFARWIFVDGSGGTR